MTAQDRRVLLRLRQPRRLPGLDATARAVPRRRRRAGLQAHAAGWRVPGHGNRSPAEVPAKSRYVRRDLEQHAARYGVPLRFNPHFPVNTLLLMRGATAMQMHDGGARFGDCCRAMFQAMWVDEKNMGDPAVVGVVLPPPDPAQVLAQAGQQPVKDRLAAVTEEAVARGVFGAPTMFVGERMFWGQDRLDWVREALG